MEDWLSHRAGVTPETTALIRAESGEKLDFGSLNAMVDDLAGRLAGLGVESGDHLGMVMEPQLAAVCTVHAAARLGAVLVPMSDRSTPAELVGQAETADVTTVVCSSKTEQQVVEAMGEKVPLCSVDDPKWEVVDALGEATPVDFEPATWELSETRLLLFTSGTTGDPKAVRLTAGNLLWSAIASAFRLGIHRDDRWLVTLSLHHVGGLTPILRMPLYGLTIVLRESFDAGGAADDIDNYDVTCTSLVPTMLKRMLDLRGTLADSLRVVLLGGAPAPEELLERCRNFSVPVYPTYGMTEAASQIATATPREAFSNIGTVGRPLMWTDMTVVDESGEAELPASEVGELVVSGPTISPGYYDNPEATVSAFGPNGLHTGDVGYRDEKGRLYLLGRVDDRIITGGENVYPSEVEGVLRDHPDVADAVVVGIPDDEWGEQVAALVVPTVADLSVGELETHCREQLAGFKLPRVIAFTDELPRTDSGTVRRDAVRAHFDPEELAIPDAETAGESEGTDDTETTDGVPTDDRERDDDRDRDSTAETNRSDTASVTISETDVDDDSDPSDGSITIEEIDVSDHVDDEVDHDDEAGHDDTETRVDDDLDPDTASET